ncbi:retrotransposon protein, putative, ty1-copia subclass [Tanacetum coccineum]
MALPVQNINHSAFRSMFEKEKLSGNNFNEWFARLKLVLRVEKKMHVIEQPLPPAPEPVAEPNVVDQWTALYDAHTEIACLMLGSMTPELHRQFELYYPFDMIQELRSMFEKQAGVEKFDLIQSFHACKQEEGKPVADYVLKMKGYVEKLERLGYVLPQDISVGLILNGLTKDFVGFVRNYNMHNMGKTIGEIHAMLIEYEKGLPKKAETPQVMMIKSGKIQKANKKSLNAKGKNKVNGKGKDKKVYIPKPNNPKPTAKERPAKDDACHHCKEVGHFLCILLSCRRRGSKLALPVLRGFRIERKLKQGALYLYVGNGVRAQVEAIGSFDLVLPNGLVICLDNCHYAPTITRGVVSVSRLVDNGFVQCFTDCGISVSKNGVLYFNAVSRNGIYEIDMHDLVPNVNSIYNVSNKRVKHNLDSTYLWHCRLAHINKKLIKQLQQDGLLKSTDDESFDKCESCLSGKMTKKPFPHSNERAKDLLGIIHTDAIFLLVVRPLGASGFLRKRLTWMIRQMDVKTTFLNGYLDEDIYMVQPEGNPKGNDGFNYFNFPPENKIVVARYANSLRSVHKSRIKWEVAVILKKFKKQKIQHLLKSLTSNNPQVVEGLNHQREGFRSYKAAMLDSESNKWIDAMNAEIQSMMDNMETEATFKNPFMVLSKHQEAGIKDLMRNQKWFGFTQILMDPCVYQKLEGSNVTYPHIRSGLEDLQAKYHWQFTATESEYIAASELSHWNCLDKAIYLQGLYCTNDK